MSYSSYQRKSLGENNRGKYVEDLTYDFQPSQLAATSPLNKQTRTRNRYTSHEKPFEYDIGEPPRPRTPSAANRSSAVAHGTNFQDPVNDKGNSYGKGAQSGSKNPVQRQQPGFRYADVSQDSVMMGNGAYSGKYHNKRVYFNDFSEEPCGKLYEPKQKNYKRASNQSNHQLFDQSQADYEQKENYPLPYKEPASNKGYERKTKVPSERNPNKTQEIRQQTCSTGNRKNSRQNLLVDDSFKSREDDRKKGESQREIIKKINRINNLNQEINSRLQRMISKIGNSD